ncbi:MAG: MFS transporter [Elusimicrobiales bacterium]|nr:MFS transporter [Elusimicrobiales bacterium]
MPDIKKKFTALFISAFASMLGMGIIVPLMPVYAKTMGASGLWLGLIFSGFSLSRLIFMPLMGKMSDKKGRKIFICSGLFLYSFISVGYIFTNSIFSLVWIRILHGFASAMIVPIIMAYVGDIAPKGKEGRFMGYFNVSFFMGMGLGPFIGGILNDSFGMSSAFIVVGLLAAAALIFTLLFLPEGRNSVTKKDDLQKNPSFKKLFRNNLIKGLLIYRFIGAVGRGPLMAFLPLFAANFGITASQIGIIISSHMLLMSILQIPFGRMADRYSKIKLIIFSGLIMTTALGLIPFVDNFRDLFLLNILMGVGGGMGMPAATAINAIAGKKYGMASSMSLFSSAMSAGMVISPLIAGILMDTVGLKYVFFFGSSVTFFGVLVFYSFVKKYKKQIEKERIQEQMDSE